MNFRSLSVFMVSVFIVLASQLARAEAPAAYCASDDYRRLDFWVGTWRVHWGAGDQAGEGTNVITRSYDDCVIEENFDGGVSSSGQHFRGMSISIYDQRGEQWRQTWMDNQGGFFDFYGLDLGDEFVFQTKQSVKKPGVILRMLFTDIKPDSLTWRWQKSEDLGNEWKDLWVIYYERLK
ncbi:hypothetical protein [Emcibacter nanhaiensis]|uniref:DUF1579 domain-containing protein n=1 Tax=Emcibacter nanhaiensis TaxID=1505037 RepID=A0A501PBW1_9PROT|nr:hypothetical protein [Emcibacter nanhaiensis]TPD57466.1 hypothetical protein FIV46_15205 [Emcibacter nanhaiensis]